MKAVALNLLHAGQRARRESRLDDARRDVLRAVEICRAAEGGRDLAFALARFGQIERDRGDLGGALGAYGEAAAIYRDKGDVLSLAHTLRHIGDIHQDAGDGDVAEPFFSEALALYTSGVRQARRNDVANAIRSMAIHKEAAGDLERARELWQQARDLYASLDNPLKRLFRRAPNAGVIESSRHLARLARA